MRGEDRAKGVSLCRTPETPPHAWGRRGHAARAERFFGNTPTCVGKTASLADIMNSKRKHPHMRGEDAKAFARVVLLEETPPHAWGRHGNHTEMSIQCGNTPTCVGKTTLRRTSGMSMQKHPHMRGEDALCLSDAQQNRETPPHAWGRLHYAGGVRRLHGNTPTCVGKTPYPPYHRCGTRKHPHMRGEDAFLSIVDSMCLETPPHAWGRPHLSPIS